MTKRTLLVLAIGVVLVAAVTLVYLSLSSGRFVTGTIDYVVMNLVNASGMSPFLARGLVILGTIPFFWAVARFTKRAIGFKRLKPSLSLYTNPYGVVIVSYVAVFFLVMYVASRESYFGHSTGEALKWCAETPEGIRVLDSPGVDPVYGITLRPCSGGQIASLRAGALGLQGPKRLNVNDPSAFEFFDGISGRPKAWYGRGADGAVELFDRAGRHPGTGEELRPVDAVTVAELVRLHDEAVRSADQHLAAQKGLEARALAAQKDEAARKQVQDREAAARATREATVERYVSRSVASKSTPALLVVDAAGQIDRSALPDIASALGASGGLLKPAFVSDGAFERAFAGDASDIARLGLQEMASAIVLGRMTSVTSSDVVGGEQVFKTRTTIEFRVYKLTPEFPSRTVSATGTGGGFSGAAAQQKSLEAVRREAVAQLRGIL